MGFPDFTAFYRALHQREPFPWQQALADRLAARGWPDTVEVPTGLGKTTTVTVAVWELARQVYTGEPRTAPLRTVHIVDRTTLVDQTHADLAQLHTALHEAAAARWDGPVGTVARALADTFGTPLVIGHAHGSDTDDGWISSPRTPVVVTMTAHQAVSRVLFRGFGISSGMRPVHAALLGVDALLLLDEPHLSTAALTTLRTATQLQRAQASLPVPHSRVVAMGATIPGMGQDALRIGPADHAHPVAGARLTAPKTLHVATTRSAGDAVVEKALIKAAQAELTAHPDQSLAVVCNTVSTARTVFDTLRGHAGNNAVLVTSRVRGHERTGLNAVLASDVLPRLLVATQTIEAGVDLSVPTMVTEVSEWSSLVQRIGRVNRYGTTSGKVVLIATPPDKARPGTEAIYGHAAAGLAALAAEFPDETDVSPVGLARLREQHADLVAAASAPHPPAPTLTSEMLPTVAHTAPPPSADIDVQPFITGVPERQRAEDVTVAWREVCDPAVLADMPPRPEETVSLPISAVQHLLRQRLHPNVRGSASPAVGDAGQAAETTDARWSDTNGRVAVSTGGPWRTAISSEDVVPGAWVVLHSTLGGHDDTGWNPDAIEPVLDLAAYYRHAHRQWWLLTAEALAALHAIGVLPDASNMDVNERLDADPDELDELAEQLLPAALGPLQFGQVTDDGLWVRATREDEPPAALVTLDDHACHVAERAAHSCNVLDLPSELAAAVTWAGYRHDDGKDDDAFQARLAADPAGPALAKQHPRRSAVRQALPRGWRHESASAQRVADDGGSPLLVHLVAAHHGWARPLMPPAHGPDQAFPTADRFAALNTEWGPWGLAWLETLVRLADHEASATPESGHRPPLSAMPRDQPEQHQRRPIEHRLGGIPADTHLHWWAALGAFAAACEIDPHATLRFDPHPAGAVPVLHTEASLDAITDQVVLLRESVARVAGKHPGLAAKNEKMQATAVRSTLAALDEQSATDRATCAALLDDTQIPSSDGRVEPRVPWRHGNSTLIGTVVKQQHPSRRIADALRSDEIEQHDDAKSFGLLPDKVDPAPTTGIPHTCRSALLPLVLAATCRLPATGCARPAGTTVDRRRSLPTPRWPVSWDTLIALLQTLPQTQDRPWPEHGIDYSTWKELPAQGKTFGWIAD